MNLELVVSSSVAEAITDGKYLMIRFLLQSFDAKLFDKKFRLTSQLGA